MGHLKERVTSVEKCTFKRLSLLETKKQKNSEALETHLTTKLPEKATGPLGSKALYPHNWEEEPRGERHPRWIYGNKRNNWCLFILFSKPKQKNFQLCQFCL